MNKHTPGPWNIFLPASEGDHLCIETEAESVCDVVLTKSDARQLANAHLIAAAPELLAALEFLFVESERQSVPRPDDGFLLALIRARDVLTKVKGEVE
jgi:hypothetical protein